MSGKERVGGKGATISPSEKSVRPTLLRVPFCAERIFAIDEEELRDGLGCKLFHSMAHGRGIPLKKGIRVTNSREYKPFSCVVVCCRRMTHWWRIGFSSNSIFLPLLRHFAVGL